MVRCKAGEILSSEAYFMYAAATRPAPASFRRGDEPNAAEGRDGRLSTASLGSREILLLGQAFGRLSCCPVGRFSVYQSGQEDTIGGPE